MLKVDETLPLLIKDYNQRTAVCQLRILISECECAELENALVILTELPSNEGMSITNAAELFATAVVDRYTLDPQRVTWIEHYPLDAVRDAESYDEVRFSWDGRTGRWLALSPRWERLSPADVQARLAAVGGS